MADLLCEMDVVAFSSLIHLNREVTQMSYVFVPMTEEHATTITATWKYPAPFDVYNYDKERETMFNRHRWGRGLFAVLNEHGNLVGELNCEFYDQNDNYLEEASDGADLWIGFGLAPQLTGQGSGAGFVTACLDFAINHFAYSGAHAYLAVAEFNHRARKAYSKAGFVEAMRHPYDSSVIWMKKELKAHH